MNAVQGKGVRSAGDGAPKGDSAKGAKARGKGKGLPAFEVQYPADILCPNVDQGKPCEDIKKPGGCPHMHPEEGMDGHKKKKEEQVEEMRKRTEGKMVPPPRPEWTFEQCAKNGICFNWMRRGVCLTVDCKYKHFINNAKDDESTPAQANMVADLGGPQELDAVFGPRNKRIWFGAHVSEVTTNKALEGKVLLDTGANEIVRGYNYHEWANIDMGRPGTRKTQVKLASGK